MGLLLLGYGEYKYVCLNICCDSMHAFLDCCDCMSVFMVMHVCWGGGGVSSWGAGVVGMDSGCT